MAAPMVDKLVDWKVVKMAVQKVYLMDVHLADYLVAQKEQKTADQKAENLAVQMVAQ